MVKGITYANLPNEVDISVMYDVACTLVQHLKVIYKEFVMQSGLPLTSAGQ